MNDSQLTKISGDLDARLAVLAARGVKIIDPRQTFVDADVRPERIYPGAVLHPGTRLQGTRTFLAPGAQVGREGPATIVDGVLGVNAGVDSGYANGAVLLAGARAGANAHLREGTLLEEEASTAHAVGLKQTVLLSFVTLGSLINFCDVLMAGGTSRDDHAEVGSGFIHFNFTPWGRRGDKATASLVGDVVHGVFLREPRIFLGGAGGMVGPRSVGFGAVSGAGHVLRRDLPGGRLSLQPVPTVDEPTQRPLEKGLDGVLRRNVEFMAQLAALQAWYRQVRLARAKDPVTEVLCTEALVNLDQGIKEREKRLRAYLEERGRVLPKWSAPAVAPCPLSLDGPDEHVAWVRGLSVDAVQAGQRWLEDVAATVRAALLS